MQEGLFLPAFLLLYFKIFDFSKKIRRIFLLLFVILGKSLEYVESGRLAYNYGRQMFCQLVEKSVDRVEKLLRKVGKCRN